MGVFYSEYITIESSVSVLFVESKTANVGGTRKQRQCSETIYEIAYFFSIRRVNDTTHRGFCWSSLFEISEPKQDRYKHKEKAVFQRCFVLVNFNPSLTRSFVDFRVCIDC
jgi:hypothetical protein